MEDLFELYTEGERWFLRGLQGPSLDPGVGSMIQQSIQVLPKGSLTDAITDEAGSTTPRPLVLHGTQAQSTQ
jgi:hypothetical protein